jgi:hypothetical protein
MSGHLQAEELISAPFVADQERNSRTQLKHLPEDMRFE